MQGKQKCKKSFRPDEAGHVLGVRTERVGQSAVRSVSRLAQAVPAVQPCGRRQAVHVTRLNFMA